MREHLLEPGDDIHRAAAVAEPGDLLRFAPGTFDLPGRVLIQKSLRLEGAGAGRTQIRGASGHFGVQALGPPIDIVMSGMTLTGARSDSDGASVFLQGAYFALSDLDFRDNRVPDQPAGSGGALAVRRSQGALRECAFVDGAAPEAGALLLQECRRVLLVGCHFQTNRGHRAQDVLVSHCGDVALAHVTFGPHEPNATGARLVVVGLPAGRSRLRIHNSLFAGTAAPLACLNTTELALEIGHTALPTGFRTGLEALLDSAGAGSRLEEPLFEDVSLSVDPARGLAVVPPAAFIGRQRGGPLPATQAEIDLFGRPRGNPPTIGAVEPIG